MTDIEIAEKVELEKISRIAEKLNIDEDDIETYTCNSNKSNTIR